MSAETEVEEGAPLGEHAAPLHGVVLAHSRVALEAIAVLAWEAVACHGSVDLVALGSELAVSVLVELADGGHSDFLSFNLSLKEVNQANISLVV